MSQDKLLRGSCHCGRIRYVVEVPIAFASQAEVFFDHTSASRRAQATPFTAWLRIPLSWYHSSTYAYYPDETHSSIRRTYLSASASSNQPSQRQFCGFCGTHLSNWTERTTNLADMIDVTLGSLLDEDLNILESEGLLGSDGEEEEKSTADENNPGAGNEEAPQKLATTSVLQDMVGECVRSYSWFEKLGDTNFFDRDRVRRQEGAYTSEDGNTIVKWEIVEVDGDDSMTGVVTGKRKLADV